MELAEEIGSYDLPKVKLNGGSDGTVGNWSRCHQKISCLAGLSRQCQAIRVIDYNKCGSSV